MIRPKWVRALALGRIFQILRKRGEGGEYFLQEIGLIKKDLYDFIKKNILKGESAKLIILKAVCFFIKLNQFLV